MSAQTEHLASRGVDLHLTLDEGSGLTQQIYDQIRSAILSGRLPSETRLPSSRALAQSLGIARNTVAAAFDHLLAEGYIHARTGVGTFVSPDADPAARPPERTSSPLTPVPLWRSSAPDVPVLDGEPPAYDFRSGMPDDSRFPYPAWRRHVDGVARRSSLGAVYADPAGPGVLRAAIARHLGVSRGLSIGADDLIVTNGVQQALSLLAQVLVEPGDVVAVRGPRLPAGPPGVRGRSRHHRSGAGRRAGHRRGPTAAASHRRLRHPRPPVPPGCPDEPRPADRTAGVGARGGRGRHRGRLRHRLPVRRPPHRPPARPRPGRPGGLHRLLLQVDAAYAADRVLRGPSDPARRPAPGSVRCRLARADHHPAGVGGLHRRGSPRRARAPDEARVRTAAGPDRDGPRPRLPHRTCGRSRRRPGCTWQRACEGATHETVAEWITACEKEGVALQAVGDFALGDVQPGVMLGFGAIPLDRIDEGLRRLRMVIGS